MDAFTDSLLNKRTALLDSLKEPRKQGSLESRSKTLVEAQGTALDCDSLKDDVYHSIRMLLCRGYNFHKILMESGVNKAFLKEAFYELGIRIIQKEELPLCQLYGDSDDGKCDSQLNKFLADQAVDENFDDSKSSEGDHRGGIREINHINRSHQKTSSESVDMDIRHENTGFKSKNVEVEMRLFMLRIQLEMNKFSTLISGTEFAEQLENQLVQKNILSKRNLMISNLNEVFDKICEKGRKKELEQSANRNIKNNVTYAKRERKESHEDDNVGGESLQMMRSTKEQCNVGSEHRKASQFVPKGCDVESGSSTGSSFPEISKVCLDTLYFIVFKFLLTNMVAGLHELLPCLLLSHGRGANYKIVQCTTFYSISTSIAAPQIQ